MLGFVLPWRYLVEGYLRRDKFFNRNLGYQKFMPMTCRRRPHTWLYPARARARARAPKIYLRQNVKKRALCMEPYLLKYRSQHYIVIHFWNRGRLRIPIKTILLHEMIYFVFYGRKLKICREMVENAISRKLQGLGRNWHRQSSSCSGSFGTDFFFGFWEARGMIFPLFHVIHLFFSIFGINVVPLMDHNSTSIGQNIIKLCIFENVKVCRSR